MNSGNSESEQQLAVLGLMLGYEQPTGEPPTLVELDQFISGGLSSTRSEEVLSYIANETTYFEQWRELQDAHQWLDDEHPEYLDPAASPAKLSDEDQIAALGLALGRTEPFGEPPDLIEIDQWQADQIDTPRGAEIASYLANDSRYFNQWRDLQEARLWLDDNPDDVIEETSEPPVMSVPDEPVVRNVGFIGRVAKKFTSASNLSRYGAVAAAVLVVFVVPFQFFSSGPADFSLDDQFSRYSAIGAPAPVLPWEPGATKSLQSPPDELLAFRVGAVNAIDRLKVADPDFDWSDWNAVLPDADQDPCAENVESSCDQSLLDMKTLGEWSVLTHAVCDAADSDSRVALLSELDQKWQLVTASLEKSDASALEMLSIGDELPVCDRGRRGLLNVVAR